MTSNILYLLQRDGTDGTMNVNYNHLEKNLSYFIQYLYLADDL